jgi:hypothetical protein
MSRVVDNEYERKMLIKRIEQQKLPFTVEIAAGKHRTTEQNRLQRLWVNEIAQQRGDITPEEARGYCKLHFGVPILRNDNEEFCRQYDEIVRPLPYEMKLRLMMVPFDFGVTRLMNTKQKTAYLDEVLKHFTAEGVVLTIPDEMRSAA